MTIDPVTVLLLNLGVLILGCRRAALDAGIRNAGAISGGATAAVAFLLLLLVLCDRQLGYHLWTGGLIAAMEINILAALGLALAVRFGRGGGKGAA